MRYLWLVVGLAGCPWVGGGKYDERVRDLDGDGGIAVRFGGTDCLDDNPEIADCDDDGDGYLTALAGGDDCDDTNGSVHPGATERCNAIDDDCDGAVDNDDADVVSENTYFVDADDDGDGDPDEPRACQEDRAGGQGALFVDNDDDCNDTNPLVSTNATEVCDGIDNNCDGVIDDVGTWFVDADGDGFGNPNIQAVGSCDLSTTTGLAAVGNDCDDTDPHTYPGAPEGRYDGVDANCNGGLDDWDADLDGYVPSEHWAAAEAANLLLPVAQQWDISNGDCDDDDPRRFEGNPEVCDGVDNDCDERVDVEDLEGVGPTEELVLRGEVQAAFLDLDGDGHFGTPLTLCPADVDPVLHSLTEDDCYDGGEPGPFGSVDPALVYDGAPEICDGVDNDCNGRADWSFATFTGATEHYVDGDGDGYGADVVFACGVLPAAGIVAQGADCNDGDAQSFPGAPEVCGDIVRQDCSTLSVWDCDGDGQEGDYLGNGSGEDCNDLEEGIYRTDAPAFEICDGIDNDCDGLVDSADPDNLDTSTLALWYPDLDQDGWGVDQGDPIQQCDPPSSFAAPRPGDCDDSNPDLTPETPWFLDQDGDGFGTTASSTVASCDPPDDGPWVRLGGDCNDLDPIYNPNTIWYPDLDGDFVGNPAAAEQFCNPPAGTSYVLASAGEDCNDDNPDVQGTSTWYADADNDGWGDDDVSTQSCARPVIGQVQFVVANGDCDDDEAAVNPLQTESCNAVDDDCDGLIDDLDPNLVATPGGPRGYLDEDGDGTGRSDVVKDFCVALPPGWAPISGDCADDDAHVYPGAIEICGNGIDDDCVEGEQIPVWYVDADGDGFGTGAASAPSCDPPAGYSATAPGDCNDAQALSYPGAPERDACDTLDDNCDGQPEPRLTWYFDQDFDGYGNDDEQVTTCVPPTAPPPGASGGEWVLSGGDCDDADASITFGRLWYVDADGDGLGNDTAAFFDCPVYDGLGNQLPAFLLQDLNGNGTYDAGDVAASIFAGDCDDANPVVGQARGYRVDVDGDGWGSRNVAEIVACPTASGNPPPGLVTRSGDCVDVPSDDPDTLVPPELINPESIEILDDLADNDCDGFTDQIGGGIAWFEDADGDGLGGSALASYEPGAVTNGQDCDDGDATIANGLFLYNDGDGDGFGGGTAVFSAGVCTVPTGKSLFGGDCNDTSSAVKPGAPEVCDGDDDDCDGVIDDGVSSFGYADADDDGHGDADRPGFFCPAELFVADLDNGADCDDDDETISPSAIEICDGIDNNCADGIGDEAVPLWYLDGDGDLVGSNTAVIQACVEPGPDWLPTNGDCNDTDASVRPGASETCNGRDDNCDGAVDEGFTLFTAYRDEDGDGAVVPGSVIQVCTVPVGYTQVLGPDDCNDGSAAVSPLLPELCADGLDNDCSGVADDSALRYADADLDGYGWPFTLELAACSSSVHADVAGDCDDTQGSRNPGAADDTCDGVDNDCDNLVDEDAVGDTTYYRDLDHDGFGDPSEAVSACAAPAGYVIDDTDCDDLRGTAFPGAAELCNGLDDDCDGDLEPTTTWYADLDRDGYRSDTDLRVVCATEPAPAFYDLDASAGVDCDDDDEDVSPDADEVCGDGVDNDCDASIDEDGQRFVDLDRDGFGSSTLVLASCASLDHSDVAGDCDDDAPSVNPGVTSDGCDGTDDDCDGATDEDATFLTYYVDGDADGYGVTALSFASCDGGAGGSTTPGDCDDGRASVNPGVTVEACNGLDDDCAGGLPADELDGDGDGFLACEEANDADPNDTPNAPTWYADVDGDGFGDDANTLISLANPGPGWTQVSGDCNDDDASMSPGVPVEFCDGKDNNCDGAEYWGNGHFIGFDVSNPLTGALAEAGAVRAWLHDHDLDGVFSADRTVFTCHDDAVSSAELHIDATVIPLLGLGVDDVGTFLAATDCINGNTGAFYAYDRDGDTVPGLEGVRDLAIVCDGSTPAAPWYPLDAGTQLDCSPADPTRAELVATGEYADADGDGVVSLVPVPGACVALGSTQSTPGFDCDDADGDTTDVLPGIVDVTTSAELSSYLGTCRVASFKLAPGFTSLGTLTLPDFSDITIEGNGSADCDDVMSSGCVTGDLIAGLGSSLTLHGVGLFGSIVDTPDATLVLDDVALVNGQLLKEGGVLQASNVRFYPAADQTEAVSLSGVYAVFQDSSFFGNGQDGLVITGGETQLYNVSLGSFAKALRMFDAVVYGEIVDIDASVAPLDVAGPASNVFFYAMTSQSGGTSQVFNGFFGCDQCSFRFPSGPVVRVQNAVSNFPTVDLYNPLIESDSNTSGGVFEVNGGNATFSVYGLQFDFTPNRPIVVADGGRAHVYDTYLNDYPSSVEAPYQVKNSGYLLLASSGGDATSIVSTGLEPTALVQVSSNGQAELLDGFSRHFALASVEDGVLRATDYEIRPVMAKRIGTFLLADVELEGVRLHLGGAPEEYFTLDQTDFTAIDSLFHAEDPFAEWPLRPFSLYGSSAVFLQTTVYGPGKFTDGTVPMFYIDTSTAYLRDALMDAGSGCLWVDGGDTGQGAPPVVFQDSWIDYPEERGIPSFFGEPFCFPETVGLGTIGEEFFTGEPTYDGDIYQTNPLLRYSFGELAP